jgi:hypothetical protein
MKKGVVLLLLALGGAMAVETVGTPPAAEARDARDARAAAVVSQIRYYRGETWRWQRLMRVPRTASHGHERWARDPYRTWIRNLWRKRAGRAYRRVIDPPHEPAWRCIQRYEGRWNDPGAPYYGGLQMDLSFQRMYGADLLRRKGTANNWTPIEQMWVAERALRAGRGFYPWPNTARYCGLI